MPYQAGTATSAAMTTGNPYIVAAAAAVDIYMSLKSADESAKQARKLRDSQVQQEAAQNTIQNLELQKQQNSVAREDVEAQLKALETSSKIENSSQGVQSTSLGRAVQKYTRQFTAAIAENEEAMRISEVQHRMGQKASSLQANDRINSIPMYKADVAGTLVDTGLTIYGMNQQKKQQQAEADRLGVGAAGAQTVGGT